jgi:predicted O-linked N-acetylglucosamine transferase (SPINDLY family)
MDQSGNSQAMSFEEVVASAEALGSGHGLPAVIKLYCDWIAKQPHGARYLHAAWFNLGTELSLTVAIPNAIQAYRSALSLKPDFHPAAINLGLLLERQGQTDAALQVWTDSLQSDEARTALLNQRARLLEQTGQLFEAADLLRVSLLTCHDQPDVVQHWLHLRQKMCQWPVLTDLIPGLAKKDLMMQCGPLAGLALTDDVPTQCAMASAWVRRKTSATPGHLAPPDGYGHARIRVGYLSSDFCRHAMSYLIAELFERHDRARFEVFGYCNSPDDGSDIRIRVIAAFDHFHSIRNVSDEDAARQIRDDEIDILIDLNGLTSGARPQVLRWKPAPVQATYLGFIGPVPIPEIDFILCDEYVIPAEQAGAYQPEPLPIKGIYQANDSKREVGLAMTRKEAGLPEDRFVYCCFSNYYKITETMFNDWMQIMQQTDAVLWLVDDNQWARQNLRLRAMISGVHPSRLIFAPRVDPARYMARLSLADLFLDTFPYNAGTIASDAIRMGLPILTRAGDSFASRMAARMLTAIGADDGITVTSGAYIATAAKLANDSTTYTAFRSRFNAAAWARTIGNIDDFTRNFEFALAKACHSRIKDGLQVEPT